MTIPMQIIMGYNLSEDLFSQISTLANIGFVYLHKIS